MAAVVLAPSLANDFESDYLEPFLPIVAHKHHVILCFWV